MKSYLYLFVFILLFSACSTVSDLHVQRSEDQLKSDLDYTYDKLQKLHPKLYWYISKPELDFKFDSLKSNLNGPMSSREFFFHLSPVISAIKQGHTKLSVYHKKMGFKTIFEEVSKMTNSLYQFEYVTINDKLYIEKNDLESFGVKPGSEVLMVNHFKPEDIISKHHNTFASDGYNKTFIDRRLGRDFPAFFYSKYNLSDSVFCTLKYNDTITTIFLKDRVKPILNDSVMDKKEKSEKLISKNNRKERKKERKKEKERTDIDKEDKKTEEEEDKGLDLFGSGGNKKLDFIGADSSIAYLKIPDFIDMYHGKFYSKTFSRLDSLKTENLIIDLRDNPGGLLAEVKSLYSYLIDSSFVFIDKSEVVSRWSVMHASYFKDYSLFFSSIMAIGYPFEMLSRLIFSGLVSKDEEGRYLMPFPGSKESPSKKSSYKGDLYVLINGGSFSASCILSSNLKGTGRAFFVGEETGGAFNGTVAGKMKTLILPESKLSLKFGLLTIQPFHKTDIVGRGIFPDMEIKPTLDDIIQERDPALDWILKEIEK